MRPETSDSQFTWQGFQAANNNELLANLGNLVNRLAKFVNSKYDGIIPDYTHGDAEDALVKDVNVLLKSYNENLEGVKIRQGLRTIMEISTRGNVYLQENKIDNALFSEQRERCDSVVATAANLCYLISALVYPYMPTTSEGILRVLNLPLRKITDEWTGKDIIGGHKIGAAEYLFKRIEDKKMDECRRLYSGQNTAAVEEPAKKSRKPAKKSEPVPPAVLTPEMKALQDRISEQGLVVRELKEKKATATEIKAAVDVLLALKKDFNASISG
jgi:methionyl-tRNA synthetase